MLTYIRFRKTRYKGESIVDGLKQSVYGRRRKWPSNQRLFDEVGTLEEIAEANRLSYADPYTAHIAMLELLKQGKLTRPSVIVRNL